MEPLRNIRVLALEQYYSGNIGSMYLGRLGAEVIKIEPPDGGDVLRNVGPSTTSEGRKRNVSELRTMGGKRSVCIDLRNPAGMATLWQLVQNADVVWTNMKPSSLTKLGITFDAMASRNERIVYTTISGFGHDDLTPSGPFGGWTAFDLIAQGLAGLQFRSEGAEGQPGYNGLPLGDFVTAMLAVTGTIAALYRRDREGGPQRVDVAMHDAMMALNELPLGLLAFSGVAPPRGRSGTSAPYGSYRAKDGFINVAVGGNPIWRRFCVAIGRPELAEDNRFRNAPDRVRNHREIDEIVASWSSQHTMMEGVAILERYVVPAAPVYDLPQVLTSPQAEARNMFVTITDPIAGDQKIVGNPIKMSGIDDKLAPPPHDFAADTASVLREVCGMSDAEIAQLLAAGAIQFAPTRNS